MRLPVSIVLGLLCLPAGATGYYHDPHYGYRHFGFAYELDPLYRAELARIRDSLRAQRLQLRDLSQRHARQLDLLHGQIDRQQRVSAEQACYYRTTGGLEACEDMFESGSEGRRRCEDTVRVRNPGCNPPIEALGEQ